MARTFSGLKLQGTIGKFGKTEICNLSAAIAVPRQKVIYYLHMYMYAKHH